MIIKSVGWTATALVVSCLLCSGIMADSVGECYKRESYNALRSIPYKETYNERCWLFRTCVRTRTKYINEKYQVTRLNKTCCEGYGNKSGTCQPQYLSGCQNCQKPFTCCDYISRFDYKNLSECRSVCIGRTRRLYGVEYCNSEYVWNNDYEECWPKCNPFCAVNAWCQKPNTCVCKPRYVGDGTSCLPVCKQGCANGKCTAPDKCSCNKGWSGDSCDKPLACVVASIGPESYSNDTLGRYSNFLSITGIDVKINTFEIAKTVPACDLKCPDELRIHAFGSIKSRENVTYFLIPYNAQLGSTCSDTESEQSLSGKHSSLIVGLLLAVAILLLSAIIYVKWIVPMRGKVKKTSNDEPQSLYDDVGNSQIVNNAAYEDCVHQTTERDVPLRIYSEFL